MRRQSWITRYLDFSFRHKVAVVFTSLLLAGAGVWCSLKIHLDSNLSSLLPKNTETIRAMQEANNRFGSSDLFTIAIVMDNPDTIAAIQNQLKRTLEKEWPDAVYVQVARDNSFFKQHALLYVPVPYLQQIQSKLKQLQLDLGMQSPFGADLLDDADKAASDTGKLNWFDASIPQQLGLPDEAADAFAAFFKHQQKPSVHSDEFDPKEGIPDSLRSRLMGKTREGQTVGLVQAVLKQPSSNIDYVKTVLARSRVLLAPLQAHYGKALQIGVEGPYKELEEVNSLSQNGMIATLVSVGLNILILLLFFRGVGPVLVLGWQATLSCVITLAMTALTYGHLNLYTVFVISILFGMGIDYSIYVMGYAQKMVRTGASWRVALEDAFQALFSSLLVAATTTIAGLLTLLISRFVGFYEFGVIASVGVGLSLVLTFLILPAFIFAWDGMYRRFPKIWPTLAAPISKGGIPGFLRNLNWPRISAVGAGCILAATVFLACFIPRVRFEYNFDNLRDTRKSTTQHLPVSVALNSHRTSSQPVVVFANDSANMVALHDTLLQRLAVEKDPYLRSFLTLTTFLPPTGEQRDRMGQIHAIGDLAGARVFDRATGDDSVMIHKLRDLSHTREFTSADLPPWSLNLLRERDGSYGKIGFIYGSYNSSDAIDAGKFQDRYGHFDINGEHLSAYSSSFIFSDIIRLVKADSLKMFLCMLVILIVLLALILRDRRLLLICAMEMTVGVIWNLGLLGLFHIKLGAFNLIVITTLQGYILDVCTYLLLGYMRLGPKRIGELLSNIGALVGVCTLTTTAGYAGMLFTTHLGIASIGKFAVLGLPALLITSLGLTPWLCMKLIPHPESKT